MTSARIAVMRMPFIRPAIGKHRCDVLFLYFSSVLSICVYYIEQLS